MGKNLIGNPINADAIEQLKQRSAVLKNTGDRDSNTLKLLANNNCWVKLTSLVRVVDSDLRERLGAEGETDLAKKWVLFGGTTYENEGLRYFPNSYTLGGASPLSELGYRPMPGIQGATINTVGTLGSLKQADIKVKVNSLDQLNVIDALFFRLGYSCLLEWGHTVYSLNNGATQYADDSKTIDAFPGGTGNLIKENLLRELHTRRKATNGNYDGMLGLITNYNWQANIDGSYDCTIKLTGIGSVTDSLKINNISSFPDSTVGKQLVKQTQSQNQSKEAPAKQPDTSNSSTSENAEDSLTQYKALLDGRTAPASALEGFLIELKLKYGTTGTLAEQVTRTAAAAQEPVEVAITDIAKTFFDPGLGLWPGGGSPKADSDVVTAFRYGNNPEYLLTKTTTTEVAFDRLGKALIVPVNIVTGETGDEATTTQSLYCYIKLGLLLAYLHNSAIAYEYENLDQKRPLLYINFDPESNFCFRTPQQFSSDPTVCLVPISADQSDYGKLFTINNIPADQISNEQTTPGVKAFDPTTSPFTAAVGAMASNRYVSQNSSQGQLMEIYLNVDFLLKIIQSATDQDRNFNLTLSSFLNQIMTEVQRSLGNVNEFRVGYDDNSNSITIYDDQILESRKTPDDAPILEGLPVFGLPSIAKEFSLVTETSTRIGAMLAIQAQAPSDQNSTLNKDGSTFSQLNSGIEDKVMKKKTTNAGGTVKDSGTESAESTDNSGVIMEAQSFNEFIFKFYSPVSVSTSREVKVQNADVTKNYYISAATLLKGKPGGKEDEPAGVTGNGIMPLAVNITVPGISTIKLYEAFCIPNDRLPAKYSKEGKPLVAFVVSNITNIVENNYWATQLKGQMINLPKDVRLSSTVVRQTVKKGVKKDIVEVVDTPIPSTTTKSANCKGKVLAELPTTSFNFGRPVSLTQTPIETLLKTTPVKRPLPVQAVLNCKETPAQYNNQPYAFQMSSLTADKTWTRAERGNKTETINYITLHYTVSSYSTPLTHYKNTWNKDVQSNPASADFVIGRGGAVGGFRGFKKWKANHFGGTTFPLKGDMNVQSIGIEIESWGPIVFCESSKQFLSVAGSRVIPDNEVSYILPYRGYSLWHKITDQQISSLASLLIAIYNEGILAKDFEFYPAYEVMFPKSVSGNTPPKGIITHGTGSTKKKTDIFPQPNLREMLKWVKSYVEKNTYKDLKITWTGAV